MRVRGHLGKELELYSKSGDKSAGEMRHTSFPGGSEVKASAFNAGDLGSIPGSGRSPGEGNGNPLQYLEPGRLQSTGSQRVGHN